MQIGKVIQGQGELTLGLGNSTAGVGGEGFANLLQALISLRPPVMAGPVNYHPQREFNPGDAQGNVPETGISGLMLPVTASDSQECCPIDTLTIGNTAEGKDYQDSGNSWDDSFQDSNAGLIFPHISGVENIPLNQENTNTPINEDPANKDTAVEQLFSQLIPPGYNLPRQGISTEAKGYSENVLLAKNQNDLNQQPLFMYGGISLDQSIINDTGNPAVDSKPEQFLTKQDTVVTPKPPVLLPVVESEMAQNLTGASQPISQPQLLPGIGPYQFQVLASSLNRPDSGQMQDLTEAGQPQPQPLPNIAPHQLQVFPDKQPGTQDPVNGVNAADGPVDFDTDLNPQGSGVQSNQTPPPGNQDGRDNQDNQPPVHNNLVFDPKVKAPEPVVTITVNREIPLTQLPARLSEMVRTLLVEHNPGQTTLKMKLQPEHLGEVTVKLTWSKGELSAHFITASTTARELLETSVPRLRELLAQQDIRLNEAAVFTGQQNSSGYQNYPGQGQQWAARGGQILKGGYYQVDTPVETKAVPQVLTTHSELDIVV
ncbi:flagellar hook-length control protein FliK [Desulfotomaculum nigrificans]|uniref:flagellar hook-length control protein FliK n=1 Tax=Desulfotomaculum nigrificans TaxID=1565 RepID=UPI0001FAE6EF|nr:flagellar hook-length control protein FliK [Desulfotomaculum nigrificans]